MNGKSLRSLPFPEGVSRPFRAYSLQLLWRRGVAGSERGRWFPFRPCMLFLRLWLGSCRCLRLRGSVDGIVCVLWLQAGGVLGLRGGLSLIHISEPTRLGMISYA